MKKISTNLQNKYKGCIFSKLKDDKYLREAVRIIGFTDKGKCILEELPFAKVEYRDIQHRVVSASTFIDYTKIPLSIKTKGKLIKIGGTVILCLKGICWEQIPYKNCIWEYEFFPSE